VAVFALDLDDDGSLRDEFGSLCAVLDTCESKQA